MVRLAGAGLEWTVFDGHFEAAERGRDLWSGWLGTFLTKVTKIPFTCGKDLHTSTCGLADLLLQSHSQLYFRKTTQGQKACKWTSSFWSFGSTGWCSHECMQSLVWRFHFLKRLIRWVEDEDLVPPPPTIWPHSCLFHNTLLPQCNWTVKTPRTDKTFWLPSGRRVRRETTPALSLWGFEVLFLCNITGFFFKLQRTTELLKVLLI